METVLGYGRGGGSSTTFLLLCYAMVCLVPQQVVLDCPCPEGAPYYCESGCPCNSGRCYCPTSSEITCYSGCSGSNVFPTFTIYNTAPISQVTIFGSFTAIYDNAFYLLTNMELANVCLSSQTSGSQILTTYPDTFQTANTNGISTLSFFQYNPQNLSTMSNNQYVTSLTIQKANLFSVPDSVKIFPALTQLDLSNNQISNFTFDPSSLKTLTNIDLSYNQITKLEPNSLQLNSWSSKTIKINNNQLVSLPFNAFNMTTNSTTIDASNNKITAVDADFSKWLSSLVNNTLNLSNNPLPCDSTIQWMATFVICQPAKIILARTETCDDGEPVYDYLIPYAKC